MTFWNRTILVAACAVAFSITAPAQSTIVEDSDAVGRHPFHATNDGSAFNKFSLNVPLLTVPSGKRFIVEHVSAVVTVPSNTLLVCNVGNKAYPSIHHWLTFTASPISGASPDGFNIGIRVHTASLPMSMVFNTLDEVGFNCYDYRGGGPAQMSSISAKVTLSGRMMDGFR